MKQKFFLFLRTIFNEMKSHTHIILFALTAILLFASMLQQATGLFHFKKLEGETYKQPMPKVSFAHFCDQSLQNSTEAYLKQSFGFREPLTRLYNQTQWTFFRHAQVIEDQRIVVTRDNWIFEPWTVEEYYQSRSYRYADNPEEMAVKMEAEAKRLRQIQDILEPCGIKLFVALLPGKELICSEHIPKNTRYFKEKKTTAYEFYSKRFKEIGVNHVDFANWFIQMKDTVSYPLFPQTGTHWSNLSSLYVADSLLRYMEQLGNVNLLNIETFSRYQRTTKPDNDLESLLNLIWPLKKKPNFLAGYTYPADTTAIKPKLITIGDSFYWNLLNAAAIGTPFSEYPYWYYFSTIYFGKDKTNTSQIDLLDEVFSADFIMLSYSTTPLYAMSNGFSERLLLELCYEPEEIKAKMAKVRNAITSDEERVQAIRKQAKSKNRNYEQELESEVNSIIFNNLESYFPALCDSVPAKHSLHARHLMGDSLAFIEWETKKAIAKIKGHPETMEKMREKAIQRGLDIETMILYDARWLVDYRIKNGELACPIPRSQKKQ